MSYVSDITQPQDSVSKAGSGISTSSSRASKAKIATLCIKPEFQEKRVCQRLEAERQQLGLERLDIQEEMAIAVSEDTSLNDPEDSAPQRLPFQLAEPTFPPHHAAGNIATPNLGFPHQHNQQHNQPTFSFQTDRDIVNSMPPLSNDSAHMQGAEGSHVTAVQSSVSSYHNSLANAIMQIAEISKNSKLPTAEVQMLDGDPSAYQRFLSSFRFVVESNTNDPAARLNVLIQYTTGNARKVIETCVLLPPKQGYVTVLDLLNKNFGNLNEMARKIIDDFIKGKPIPNYSTEALLE